MQYSQGNPAPTPNQLEFDELVHTVRRLAHHPSLAVYDGCSASSRSSLALASARKR